MPVLERSTILSGLLLFRAVAAAQAQPEPKEPYFGRQSPALCVAIGSGHNLEIMTARIFKVSAATSVIGIDLVRPMVMRVRPERKPALPDAP